MVEAAGIDVRLLYIFFLTETETSIYLNSSEEYKRKMLHVA